MIVLCIGASAVLAQTKQITGKVTSADDGLPIPGVSVALKGTTTGTITNVEGVFSLTVPNNEKLVFSFVGMKTMEVPITGASIYNVTMETETFGVDEVVVTALGINKSKKALGYATTTISSEELVKAREGNVVNSLAGRVAGVRILSLIHI